MPLGAWLRDRTRLLQCLALLVSISKPEGNYTPSFDGLSEFVESLNECRFVGRQDE